MACEENSVDWQISRATLRERNKFMFNNSLMSDVKFVVKDVNKTGSKISIPAHKYVLAISSPVFYAMFYGELAESKNEIQLPDCNSKSFLELLRFLYCDEAQLNGNCVLSVLYLAKKYIVPSLVKKCSEFLKAKLDADNVLAVLPKAQEFEEKDLEAKCWRVIDDGTHKVVESKLFVTASKEILVEILERDSLRIKEVELFKAVDCWAARKCRERGLGEEGKQKRAVLGEDVVHLIRFPIMKMAEFAEFVLPKNILKKDEMTGLVQFFSSVRVKQEMNFINKKRNWNAEGPNQREIKSAHAARGYNQRGQYCAGTAGRGLGTFFRQQSQRGMNSENLSYGHSARTMWPDQGNSSD